MDAESEDVLFQVPTIRSRGAVIKESYPTEFVQVFGNRIQSDYHTVGLTLTFISSDLITTLLARGVSVFGTSNTPCPSAANQYSILLVSPNSATQTSYYFPAINSLSNYSVGFKKDAVYELEINFQAQARDFNTILFYRDTLPNLVSVMGSRSPF
jgi:hypothetical protein